MWRQNGAHLWQVSDLRVNSGTTNRDSIQSQSNEAALLNGKYGNNIHASNMIQL